MQYNNIPRTHTEWRSKKTEIIRIHFCAQTLVALKWRGQHHFALHRTAPSCVYAECTEKNSFTTQTELHGTLSHPHPHPHRQHKKQMYSNEWAQSVACEFILFIIFCLRSAPRACVPASASCFALLHSLLASIFKLGYSFPMCIAFLSILLPVRVFPFFFFFFFVSMCCREKETAMNREQNTMRLSSSQAAAISTMLLKW